MKVSLPPKEYHESLVKVPTSGGAIFRNSKGEFLIVKPQDKDYWDIAGGMSELNETSMEAVKREVKEELGIEITEDPRLFCIDFAIGNPFDRILFLFNCGIMSDSTIQKMQLDLDEIAEYRFATYENVLKLIGPKLNKRLRNSINAFEKGGCVYLESGEAIK